MAYYPIEAPDARLLIESPPMELSIFLAKVLGSYLLIASLAILVNHKPFNKMLNEYVKDLPTVFFHGVIALLLGLALVVSHNLWVADWRVIITIFGWLTLLKGVTHMFVPQAAIKKGMDLYHATSPAIFVIMAVLGAYLAYIGFTA